MVPTEDIDTHNVSKSLDCGCGLCPGNGIEGVYLTSSRLQFLVAAEALTWTRDVSITPSES